MSLERILNNYHLVVDEYQISYIDSIIRSDQIDDEALDILCSLLGTNKTTIDRIIKEYTSEFQSSETFQTLEQHNTLTQPQPSLNMSCPTKKINNNDFDSHSICPMIKKTIIDNYSFRAVST